MCEQGSVGHCWLDTKEFHRITCRFRHQNISDHRRLGLDTRPIRTTASAGGGARGANVVPQNTKDDDSLISIATGDIHSILTSSFIKESSACSSAVLAIVIVCTYSTYMPSRERAAICEKSACTVRFATRIHTAYIRTGRPKQLPVCICRFGRFS